MATAAAQLFVDRLRSHHESRRFMVALSGGSTPKLMYEKLRQVPDLGHLLSTKAAIFFSDERAVPPESAQSNFRTAFVELLKLLRVDEAIVHRLHGETDDLAAEAARYEEVITEVAGHPLPSFDLIFLGMGPDGHTASLFPDSDLPAGDALVSAVYVRSLQDHRLTFTFRLLNAARTVLFLVTGQEKADALKKVLSADTQADILPAGRVEARQTIWLVDSAAAQLLEPGRIRGTLTIC